MMSYSDILRMLRMIDRGMEEATRRLTRVAKTSAALRQQHRKKRPRSKTEIKSLRGQTRHTHQRRG